MENKLYVTINDYQRLIGLIEFSALKYRDAEGADALLTGLKTAKMMAQENIPDKIVTMNSRVLLREVSSGRESVITLAYPHDANTQERKISVLSRAGATLLGRRQGDVVRWKVPGGIGQFEIAKIIFQPEAAGDYYL